MLITALYEHMVIGILVDDDVAVERPHELADLGNVLALEQHDVLDSLVVLVPKVSTVHSDGHVKLEGESPLVRLVKRAVVKGASGSCAKEDALLVEAVDCRKRARHKRRPLDVDGSVDVGDNCRNRVDHDDPLEPCFQF